MAEAQGSVISGIFTSGAMLGKLRKNADIQREINGTAGAGMLVRRSDLEQYLAEEFGISQIITNDLTYGQSMAINSSTGRPAVTTNRYYPNNKVTFFANNAGGKLGIGLWGDPPETDVTQLLNVSQANAEKPFIYITQWAENDPAVLWTKASSLFMPVLYNPNSLFIASATETAGA